MTGDDDANGDKTQQQEAAPSSGTPSSSGEQANKAEAKPDTGQIQLKVRDADGNEVFFRIKKHTQLKKLMDAYCSKKGAAPGSFRFLFDGERLNEDDTPEKLSMEDMDSIDAMLYQQGGARW